MVLGTQGLGHWYTKIEKWFLTLSCLILGIQNCDSISGEERHRETKICRGECEHFISMILISYFSIAQNPILSNINMLPKGAHTLPESLCL